MHGIGSKPNAERAIACKSSQTAPKSTEPAHAVPRCSICGKWQHELTLTVMNLREECMCFPRPEPTKP